MPVGEVVGVVNNVQMHNFNELAEAGAADASDPRAGTRGVIQI